MVNGDLPLQLFEKMHIGIIDYGAGNIRSVSKAFDYLGFECSVTSNSQALSRFSHLVLPGVGSFAKASRRLESEGLSDAIKSYVMTGRPFLGICLGMQLLTNSSTEEGLTKGLGIIDAEVDRFRPESGADAKIPHVGFNKVYKYFDSILLKGLSEDSDFYFTHSYRVKCNMEPHIVATTSYCETFASVIGRDNVYGTQFHPEKSQSNGLLLLKNFALM
jgi:glutamine amidotransferase